MIPNCNSKILVVDDDEIVLAALKETLVLENYTVMTTKNPEEAIAILKKELFGVIISDQRMVEMSGLEFFEKAKHIQPNATRILITGVLKLKVIIDAVNQGEIFRFIAKPWIREELLVTVQNGMQRYHLLQANECLRGELLLLNQDFAKKNQRLEYTIGQLKQEKDFLGKVNDGLKQNFEQFLGLCYQLMYSLHPVLGERIKAVMAICKVICDSGYLTEKDSYILRISSGLYAIGLMNVSANILDRALENFDSLGENEKGLINEYPLRGAALASFSGELGEVSRVIKTHRERWDGRGYPHGLSGPNIPLPARYLNIVTYYVESGDMHSIILQKIIELSGKAFDPQAVDIFIKSTKDAVLPKKIKPVSFKELKLGMSIAKSVYSPDGKLLISPGEKVSEQTIRAIKEYVHLENVSRHLLVYV